MHQERQGNSPGATDRDDDERLCIIHKSGRISARKAVMPLGRGTRARSGSNEFRSSNFVGPTARTFFSSANATYVSFARRASASAACQTLPVGAFDQKQSVPCASTAPPGYERGLNANSSQSAATRNSPAFLARYPFRLIGQRARFRPLSVENSCLGNLRRRSTSRVHHH
jgi:hypothetical protein